ncbi:MAG: YdcF family protein [Frankia sp.]
MSTALKLAREGGAPQLVVSTPGYASCPRDTIAHVTVTCFYPHPTSTQGEARAIGQLATDRHWKRILVVTRRAQDTRTRLRVERCYPGQLLINTVSPPLRKWPYQVTYEWGALLKALVWQRGC